MTTVSQTIFGNTIGAIHMPCFRILNDVSVKIAGNNSVITLSIQLAVKSGRPAVEICKTIAEMANDNYNAIADLIGVKLTDELLTMFETHLVIFNKARQ